MLAFTGSRLDRADHIRADPEALAGQMGWRARLLALDGLLPALDDAGALQWGSLADAAQDAELVFLDTLWPDFHPAQLAEAIKWYQGRSRRFGGI